MKLAAVRQVLRRQGIASKADLLPTALTINGITVDASYVYKGADASASSWPGHRGIGPTLSLAGSGTDPSVAQSGAGVSLLGPTDQYVLFNGGKIYQGAAGTGDIVLEDFVLEAIVQADGAARPVSTVGAANGYELKFDTAGKDLRATVKTAAGFGQPSSFNVLVQGTWYHLMSFADRNETSTNGWNFYANGAATVKSSGHDISAHAASSLAGTALTLGATANSAAGTIMTRGLAWVAMWKRTDWMPGGASNPTAWVAVAAARYALLT